MLDKALGTARLLPGRDYLALKAHCRDLVAACGGPKRAAEITRGHASHISESIAPHHGDRFLAIDQVMDLESECGLPAVTQFLAGAHGFDLVPRSGSAAAISPVQHLSRLAKESGDVIQQMAEAVSDGEVSRAERDQMLREMQQLIDAAHAAMADLKPGPRCLAVAKDHG
jgi:hypothetical protein